LLEAIGVPAERQSNREAKRVRQIAEGLGWVWARKRIDGAQIKGLWPGVPTAVPTESTAVPTAVPTALTSNANGSALLCPPSPPKQKELKKKEKDTTQHNPPTQEKRNSQIRWTRGTRWAQTSQEQGSAGGHSKAVGGLGGHTPSPVALPFDLEDGDELA